MRKVHLHGEPENIRMAKPFGMAKNTYVRDDCVADQVFQQLRRNGKASGN